MIPNLDIKKYMYLINEFKTNKGIYKATKQELIKIKLINEKICNELLNIENRRIAGRYIEYMEKYKIDIVCILDKEYPIQLKEIYNPPLFLYIRGNKQILNGFNISVIGCRDCSNYGEEIAKKIAYDLSNYGFNIVSGLARGIDEYAHIGAVCAKGNTIAVLGSGVNIIYPKQNTVLANKILETNGVILSEYPINTQPQKLNFPARNRIISGLSKGVIVVEAKKKSGTLITVDFALEQGRDVFVVPRKC